MRKMPVKNELAELDPFRRYSGNGSGMTTSAQPSKVFFLPRI